MATFKGINPPKTTAGQQSAYLGVPCLHKKHSGDGGTAEAWRKSSDHACLECVEEINNGFFSLDLNELTDEAQKVAYRFWLNVDINEWEDCWRWNGKLDSNRHLHHFWARPGLWGTYRHHPIIILNWIVRGDLGRHGITSLCGENRCCNPLHQVPTGLIIPKYSEQFLEDQRDLLLQQIQTKSVPIWDDIPEEATEDEEFEYDKAFNATLINKLRKECPTFSKM